MSVFRQLTPTPDSPNIRHVSAPLAAAGISILYQSTYTGDFLLVKNSDFDRASSIFTLCGCTWEGALLYRR